MTIRQSAIAYSSVLRTIRGLSGAIARVRNASLMSAIGFSWSLASGQEPFDRSEVCQRTTTSKLELMQDTQSSQSV